MRKVRVEETFPSLRLPWAAPARAGRVRADGLRLPLFKSRPERGAFFNRPFPPPGTVRPPGRGSLFEEARVCVLGESNVLPGLACGGVGRTDQRRRDAGEGCFRSH